MTPTTASRYLTATRFALIEQWRNRFALVLVAVFVPAWEIVISWIIPATDAAFRYRATGEFIEVNGRHLSLLTGDLNAVTLIAGFMMFTATRRSAHFDRRLISAGFPRTLLILAKLSALVALSVVIAAYASLVLRIFWDPQNLLVVGVSLFTAALAYGGLGVLLGVLLPGDLEGLFLIIMISLVDSLIQNPIGNPTANEDVVRYFPTYGPMQLGVGGGFTNDVDWSYALLGPAWFAATAVLGFLVLWIRSRAQAGAAHGSKLHREVR